MISRSSSPAGGHLVSEGMPSQRSQNAISGHPGQISLPAIPVCCPSFVWPHNAWELSIPILLLLPSFLYIPLPNLYSKPYPPSRHTSLTFIQVMEFVKRDSTQSMLSPIAQRWNNHSVLAQKSLAFSTVNITFFSAEDIGLLSIH